MRARLYREEAGFSLVEMLVTMLMMIVVLFALYGIFDMTIRVYSLGNNKTEAVENARLGLEKMSREVRAAYPYDKAASPPDTHLLDTMAENEISFGNDTVTSNFEVDLTEEITYRLEDGAGGTCDAGDTCTLVRSIGAGGYQPVVEYIRAPDGLRFTYLKEDADNDGQMDPTTAPSEEPSVEVVRIELDIVVDEGSPQEGLQTLTTDVALRNRES
jgi:Tfp pilus assembly protein PilW